VESQNMMIIAKSAPWLPLREAVGIHRVLLGLGSVLILDLGRKPSWIFHALQDSSQSPGADLPTWPHLPTREAGKCPPTVCAHCCLPGAQNSTCHLSRYQSDLVND